MDAACREREREKERESQSKDRWVRHVKGESEQG